MINKIHFAKKIAGFRKRLKLSQAELAEKLCVTSQAVSKWECGATLPDVDLLLELSHLYGVTVNELLEDIDIIAKLASRTYEFDGIALFIPKEENHKNESWVKEIVDNNWVARNWFSCKDRSGGISDDIGKKISEHGGIILEIGTGPGGGFMPYILKSNPDANIIISDLSPIVVNEWRKFLDKELNSPNISYATFNFCEIPFKDNSIDVISDGGGIGNAEEGEKGKALKEVYRVLKPGGLFVTSTGFVNKETLSALPKHIQAVLKEKRPDVFEDLYEETVLAGFTKINSIISGSWDTDNDESTIADLARSLGVNLRFTSYVRFCEK